LRIQYECQSQTQYKEGATDVYVHRWTPILIDNLGEITCTKCKDVSFGGDNYYNTTNDCKDRCILDTNTGCKNFEICEFDGDHTECKCPIVG